MEVSTVPGVPHVAKTLQRPWLETASAFYYSITFLFLGIISSVLLFYLFFTPFWFLSVLYLVWFYLDRDTPSQGGRPFKWVKNWKIWKLLRSYFPIKLVQTAELPPDKNYVMAAHPHGVMTIGIWSNFATECNNVSQQFPGLRFSLMGLSTLYLFPVFRDYLLALGGCCVSRRSLDYILSQSRGGQAVVIIVGGTQEAMYSIPGKHCLVLQGRKGFVRLALRHGASLVPIYSFGENDVFNFKTFDIDSWQHTWQMAFKRLMGYSLCIFWGRSLFSAKSWGLVPFPAPITTVVGCPIPVPQCLDATEEQVDHYHALYLKALEQLFEEHKESYGVPASTHLTFV